MSISLESPPSSSISKSEFLSSLPRWRRWLSKLNWHPVVDLEIKAIEREKQIALLRSDSEEIRSETEQIRSETERIRRETEQLRKENARYAELNARIDALLSSSDTSSTPPPPMPGGSPT